MKKRIIVKTRKELIKLIDNTIEKEGSDCDLNFIDTFLITDMSYMFQNTEFNGDISEWDVSHVTDMSFMFHSSMFNGDISEWDTSQVTDMYGMFRNSMFNGDISRWDTSQVTDMYGMFNYSKFNQNIGDWNVSNVKDMSQIFEGSEFNGDISNWNVDNVESYNSFGLSKESYLPLKLRNPLEQSKSYIGWKKLRDGLICKLLIPEDAIKLKGTSNKCRTDKAKVLEIIDPRGNTKNIGYSIFDLMFLYKVGEEVVPNRFNLDRWNECSGGIHFFLNRKDAESY